jgi:hypothetical protein
LSFGPDEKTLYAVGDCNPDPVTFECNSTNSAHDPNYNSLYKVNTATGAFTRIGATGAPQFFMDLALDQNGHMLGVTTTLNPSTVPAILYSINLATGKATKIVNLVGNNYIMGLALGSDGKFYVTDNMNNPGLYTISVKTGLETAIAALPFCCSSNLALITTLGDQGD